MPKFIIDGAEYDSNDVDPSGRDLRDLPKQAGIGIQTWERLMGQIRRLAWGPDGSVVVLSESDAAAHQEPGHEPCDGCPNPSLFTESTPHMTAFLVLIWLSRRSAGETNLRFDDSIAVPFSQIDIVDDEDDPDDEAEPGEVEDPTPPPASDPATGGGTARSSRSRKASTTSTPTPTGTSSISPTTSG